MAKIMLSGGFSPMDEGITVLRIKSVDYKEDFGHLRIILENSKGKTLINEYKFGVSGENQGAINAFSFFARAAIGKDVDEIDPEELVGKYVRAEVYHTTGNRLNDKGEPRIFANSRDYSHADGFDNAPATSLNLADILGD